MRVTYANTTQPVVTYKLHRGVWCRGPLDPRTMSHYLANFALIDAYARSEYCMRTTQPMRYEDEMLPLATGGIDPIEYFAQVRRRVSVDVSTDATNHTKTSVTINGRRRSGLPRTPKRGELPLVLVSIASDSSIADIGVNLDAGDYTYHSVLNAGTRRDEAIGRLNTATEYAVGVYTGPHPTFMDDPLDSQRIGFFQNRSKQTQREPRLKHLQDIWKHVALTPHVPFDDDALVFRDLVPTMMPIASIAPAAYVPPQRTGPKALALRYKGAPYDRVRLAVHQALHQAQFSDMLERTVEPGVIVHVAWTTDAYNWVGGSTNPADGINRLAHKLYTALGPSLSGSGAAAEVWYWPACHFVEAITASDNDKEPPFSIADCRAQVWARETGPPMDDDVIVDLQSSSISHPFPTSLNRQEHYVRWAPCDAQIPSNAVVKQNANTYWRSMPALEFYHYHMMRCVVQDVVQAKEYRRYLVCDLNASSRRLLALYGLSFLRAYLGGERATFRMQGAGEPPAPSYTRIVVVGAAEECKLLQRMAAFYRFAVEFVQTTDDKMKYAHDCNSIAETDAVILLGDVAAPTTNPVYTIRFTSTTVGDLSIYHRVTFNGAAVHADMWNHVQISAKVIYAQNDDPTCKQKCVETVVQTKIPTAPDRVMLIHSDHHAFKGTTIANKSVRSTKQMMTEYTTCNDLVTIEPTKQQMRQLYSTLVGPNRLTERGITIYALFFAGGDNTEYDTPDPIDELIQTASYYRNNTCITRSIDLKCSGDKCSEVTDVPNSSNMASKLLESTPEWFKTINHIYTGSVKKDDFFSAPSASHPLLKNTNIRHDIKFALCDPWGTGSTWKIDYEPTNLTFTDMELKVAEAWFDFNTEDDGGEGRRSDDLWDNMGPNKQAAWSGNQDEFEADWNMFRAKREKLSEMTELDPNKYNTLLNILAPDDGADVVTLTEEQSTLLKATFKEKLKPAQTYLYFKDVNKTQPMTIGYQKVLKPLEFQIALAASSHFNQRTLIVSSTGSGKSTMYFMLTYYWLRARGATVVVVLDQPSTAVDQARKLKQEFGLLRDDDIKVWTHKGDIGKLERGKVYILSPNVYPKVAGEQNGFDFASVADSLCIVVDEVHRLFKTLRESGKGSKAGAKSGSLLGKRKAWLNFMEDATKYDKLVCLTATPKVGPYDDENQKFDAFFKDATRVYYNGLHDDNIPKLNPPKKVMLDLTTLPANENTNCLFGSTHPSLNGCKLTEPPKNDRGLYFHANLTVPKRVGDTLSNILSGCNKKTLIAVQDPTTARVLSLYLQSNSVKVLCLAKSRVFDGEKWFGRSTNTKIDKKLKITQTSTMKEMLAKENEIITTYKNSNDKKVVLVMEIRDYGKSFDFGGTGLLIRVPINNSVIEEQLEGRVTRVCGFPEETLIKQDSTPEPIDHLVLSTLMYGETESKLVNEMDVMRKEILGTHKKFATNATNRNWENFDNLLKSIYGGETMETATEVSTAPPATTATSSTDPALPSSDSPTDGRLAGLLRLLRRDKE